MVSLTRSVCIELSVVASLARSVCSEVLEVAIRLDQFKVVYL